MTAARLKDVADIRVSNVDKKITEGETQVRLCNYTDVYYNPRVTGDLPFMVATASTEQVQRFGLRRGDVVITKDSETADDIAVPARIETDASDLVCGYHLAIIRPNSADLDARYLYWTMTSSPTREFYTTAATGVTRFGLRQDSIGDLRVRLPAGPEQRAIADFLDAETARIDGLLELRQKQSELVAERHLVARDRILGVDRAGTRTLAPLRAMVTHIIDTAHATAPQSDSGTHSVIRTSEIRGGRLFVDQAYKTDDASYRRWTARGRPAAGDILLTREAPAGEACVVPPNAEICIGQRVVLLRVNRATAVPEFLVESLYARPARDFLRDMGRETTVSHLNMGDIPRIPVPNTSVIDQHSALRSLAAEADMASGLARSLDRQRKVLQERRQALITAAVTGEIDVSTASGRGVPA